jgi:anti-anti-sigma factor
MAVEVLDPRPLDEGPELMVEFHHIGPTCVLALRGELHAGSVGVLEAQFDVLGRTPCRRVVVDLNEVTSVDTVGARVLTGLGHYVHARGGTLTVIGTSPFVPSLAADDAGGRASSVGA